MSKTKRGRSAKTGRFVSKEFVKENPDTTFTGSVELKHKEKVETILENCISVNELAAKLSSFLKSQKNCPADIIDVINNDFWELIDPIIVLNKEEEKTETPLEPGDRTY
jgi:hypothetical protein